MRIPYLKIVLAVLLPVGPSFGMVSGDALEDLPTEDAAFLRKHLPGVVIEHVRPHVPLEKAGEWLPLEAADFEFIRPGETDKTLKMSVKPSNRVPGSAADSDHGGWMMRLPNGTVRYLSQLEDRGISAPTDVSTSNGFIIRLDPPEPIVHEGLKPGQSLVRDITVDIYDVGSPKEVAYSGKVRCTWSDLGLFKVKVPKGTYDTHLIRIEYKGSVGPASVSAKRYLFLARGLGPVAFTDMRDISAFIFFNDDTSQTGVLTGFGARKGG